MDNIALLILGIFISVIGIVNMTGNISTIHSYNRRKVKEEDVPKYGRSRRHRYAYHRRIFDSGICHNFLERKGNVFHCYSGARHRLGLYLVCTVQVQ